MGRSHPNMGIPQKKVMKKQSNIPKMLWFFSNLRTWGSKVYTTGPHDVLNVGTCETLMVYTLDVFI